MSSPVVFGKVHRMLISFDAMLQVRLDAMDKVLAGVRDGSVLDSCSVVVQGMAHIPGWNEKNFQVRMHLHWSRGIQIPTCLSLTGGMSWCTTACKNMLMI